MRGNPTGVEPPKKVRPLEPVEAELPEGLKPLGVEPAQNAKPLTVDLQGLSVMEWAQGRCGNFSSKALSVSGNDLTLV
jgi:hypothetical protein